MGKTIRKEVWFQAMGGLVHPLELRDDHLKQARANKLLDKAIPQHRELVSDQEKVAQFYQHALALPRTAQLRNPIPPPTQLARKSSLANSRLSRPDLNFATQSSPTKRKQVRLMQHGKEQVPGAGSDRGTPRSSRGTDNQDGRHKRRRLHTGEASEVDGMAVELVGGEEEGNRAETEANVADATQLSQGSIARCIPYPFRHTASSRPGSLNPRYQQPSLICHSYHDPPVPPAGLPHPRGVVLDSATFHSKLGGFIYPNVVPFLAPGRSGAWLIPLSHPLPWTEGKPTPPAWFAAPPKPSVPYSGAAFPTRGSRAASFSLASASSSLAPQSGASTSPFNGPRRPRQIEWTDTRLRAAWYWLDRLHVTGMMGPVWAECVTAKESGGLAPDHIRVHAMAHLALALRRWLGLIDVKNTEWEGEDDGVRFLDRVRLVWVDEGGRRVMVA